MFQVLSHQCRAYIHSVKGLPGFIIGYEKSFTAYVLNMIETNVNREYEEGFVKDLQAVYEFELRKDNEKFEIYLAARAKSVLMEAVHGTKRAEEKNSLFYKLRDNPEEFTYYI